MWQDSNHIWFHYSTGILASDDVSAMFLQRYMQFLTINRAHFSVMEVMDLQKYRLIKDIRKVKKAVNERLSIPFVFLACRN